MPSSLTSTKIKDTYGQVLHVDGGVTTTPKTVYDGDGTATALKVSTTGAVVETSSSTNAIRITQTGAGNALVVEDSANPDGSPFVIDTNGNVINGYTNSINFPDVQGVQRLVATQVLSNTYLGSSVGIASFINSVNSGGALTLAQSRNTTTGSHTVVAVNDTVGALQFAGSDGTNFIRAATILAAVDGTPGTNDMPGRLVFSTTADGDSTPTERMRIASDGQVTLSANAGLTISKTAVTSPEDTDGNVFSGTYTPTLTNTTNVAASTAYTCQYMRVGNVVTVSGQVAIDPTTTGAIQLSLSIPVASNFTTGTQASGTAVTATTADSARVYADTENNSMIIYFIATSAANANWSFICTYSVI